MFPVDCSQWQMSAPISCSRRLDCEFYWPNISWKITDSAFKLYFTRFLPGEFVYLTNLTDKRHADPVTRGFPGRIDISMYPWVEGS